MQLKVFAIFLVVSLGSSVFAAPVEVNAIDHNHGSAPENGDT
jgi:hypothetical protein